MALPRRTLEGSTGAGISLTRIVEVGGGGGLGGVALSTIVTVGGGAADGGGAAGAAGMAYAE